MLEWQTSPRLRTVLSKAVSNLLLLEPELVPCKNRRNNALLQAVTHGSLLDVALLLTVSFALGDDDSASDLRDDGRHG